MKFSELVNLAHSILVNIGYEFSTEKPNLPDDTVIDVPLLCKKGHERMTVSQCCWGKYGGITYYKIVPTETQMNKDNELVDEVASKIEIELGYTNEWTSEYNYKDLCNKLSVELIDLITSRKDGWVSVEDRLPEYGDRYLVLLNNGGIHILTWVKHYWADGVDTITNVTHWQNLPESPNER
jgi:hypothetical protein